MFRYFKSSVLTVIVTLIISTIALTAEPETFKRIPITNVPQYLDDISVTLRSQRGEGSGALRVTKDGQVWVLTCAHVVEGNRTTRDVVDPKSGGKKTVIEFVDMTVIRQDVEEDIGETTGDYRMHAEVIRYSDATFGDDLALLRLRTHKFKPQHSFIFWDSDKIPERGLALYHCGSLLGQFGNNSLTHGIVSQHGRMYNGKVYDQVQCTSFPGSSGGIVCDKEKGRYVGMVVRGAGEGFTLIVPARRIKAWAKRVGVEFVLDDKLPIPSLEELRAKGVDDGTTSANGNHMGRSEETEEQARFEHLYPRKIFNLKD